MCIRDRNKDPETTRDALREILDNDMTAAERESVQDITSDAGNEWGPAYRDFLATREISVSHNLTHRKAHATSREFAG